MAAITSAGRKTVRLADAPIPAYPTPIGYDVAASTTIYPGAIVCLNASGNLVPASTSTTLIAVGVYDGKDIVDNSTGAIGDIKLSPRMGVFRFENSASGDAITKAEIGDDCYLVDDQTVAKTSGSSTRSVAGKIYAVDSLGVWVYLGL